MKQPLFLKRLVLPLAAAFAFSQASAQVTIQTNYTNGALAFLTLPAVGTTTSYMSFSIQNNNPYPVALTDVGTYHEASGTYTIPLPPVTFTHSSNGATYTLLRDKGNYNVVGDLNPIGVGMANNFDIVGFSAPIYTTNNGIVPVVTGVNTVIQPGKIVRFAVAVNDSIFVAALQPVSPFPPNGLAPALPTSFAAAGVTLLSGYEYDNAWGGYPNGTQQSTLDSTAFLGFVTIRRAGPNVNIVGSPTCEGGTLELTADIPNDAPGAIVNWTGPNGQTFTGNPWIITPAASTDSGVYKVTYTFNGQTSAPGTGVAVVYPTPAPPSITYRAAYCINDPWEPPTVTGQNILWYLDSTGGVGSTVQPYVNTTIAGTYTWFASQSINGCESKIRAKMQITVAPVPPAPLVTSPVAYCENDTPSPLSAGGEGLKWYIQPFLGLGSIYPPTPNTSVKDTNTWYVSQTVMGCEGPRSRIDVITTFRPNGLIVPVRTPEICQHDTLSFVYYGSGTAMTAYNWTAPQTPMGASTVISGGGQGPFTIRFDSAGIQRVTMQAGNLTCYSEVYTQNVEVNAIPTGAIAASDNLCQNQQEFISMFHYSPTTDTFFWDWDGGSTTHYATDQGPYGVYWSTPGKKVIKVILADKICRSTVITDTVEVRPAPDATILGYTPPTLPGDKPMCTGDSLKLEPRTLVASSKYVWGPERFFDFYSEQAVTYARIDYDAFITLNVEDEFGCKNADSIRVVTRPCCEALFPNAFTPNADGKNDRFRIVQPMHGEGDNWGRQQVVTFRIHNRWGANVFESTDAVKGWDGNYNGKPQDMGTYHYYIKFKCNGGYTEQHGDLTLIR